MEVLGRLVRELTLQVEELRREVRGRPPAIHQEPPQDHEAPQVPDAFVHPPEPLPAPLPAERVRPPPEDHDIRGPGVRALKVSLPKFDGKSDIKRWIEKMESTAQLLGLNEDELAKASWLTCLQGAALTMVETNDEAKRSWVHQRETLLRHFEDPLRDITLRSRLRTLRMKHPNLQGLEGYYQEFMAVVQNIHPALPPQEEFAQFFLGLTPTVKERVLARSVNTVTDALNAGRAILSELVTAHGSSQHQAHPLQRRSSTPRPKGPCHGCGKEGHYLKDCWNRVEASGKGKGGGRPGGHGGRGGRPRSNERRTGKGSGRGTTQGRSRSPAK